MTDVVERSVRVRAARVDDAAAVLGLSREITAEDVAFAQRMDEVDPDPSRIAKRIAARRGARGVYVVAMLGDVVVGWLEARSETPARRSHAAQLVLAVAAAHRRRGIATALLHAAQAWAGEHGLEVLRVTVRVGNAAALRLYAAQGFLQESRTPRAIKRGDGHYEDVLVLSRWLV